MVIMIICEPAPLKSPLCVAMTGRGAVSSLKMLCSVDLTVIKNQNPSLPSQLIFTWVSSGCWNFVGKPFIEVNSFLVFSEKKDVDIEKRNCCRKSRGCVTDGNVVATFTC